MTAETYAYIRVKLVFKPGVTADQIDEVVSEMDYNFEHDSIVGTEIRDVVDTQVVEYHVEGEVFPTFEAAQQQYPDSEIVEIVN